MPEKSDGLSPIDKYGAINRIVHRNFIRSGVPVRSVVGQKHTKMRVGGQLVEIMA